MFAIGEGVDADEFESAFVVDPADPQPRVTGGIPVFVHTVLEDAVQDGSEPVPAHAYVGDFSYRGAAADPDWDKPYLEELEDRVKCLENAVLQEEKYT